MTDYSYHFAFDEKYCYPNSQVLINKLNIKDALALAAAEREISGLRLLAAKVQPVSGRLDFMHLKRIHRQIFRDLYSWAGRTRTIDIAKGNQFCYSYNIDQYAESLFRQLRQENYLLDTYEQVPRRLAWYLSEINVLHPFREGNGRAQRLFIEYLGRVAGWNVDFSDVTQQEMIIASADSFVREYSTIYAMFDRICSPLDSGAQHEAVDTFFGKRSRLHDKCRH